jgi:homoserine acetyltransferase
MKKISDLNGHDAIRVQNEQEKKEIQKLLDEN